MPEFVLFETFAYIAGGGRVYNFGETLVGDVPEGNLPAVVKTAGDYPAVVQYGDVRIEGMAGPADNLLRVAGIFCLRAHSRPFKSGILVQVELPRDRETLVPAAEIPQLEIDPERIADAFEHIAVPALGVIVADVPESQIDVHLGPCEERNPAKIENVLEMLAGFVGREFRIRVRREVYLAHGGAV